MARSAIPLPGTVLAAINTVNFSSFGADAGGAVDNSAIFAQALAQSNALRRPVEINAGTYLINTAPGTVLDALLHNCPEVDYPYIDLVAVGGPVVLKAATGVTAARALAGSSQATSKPILKAQSTTGGTFRMRGQFIFDGSITSAPSTTSQSLDDPQAAVLLEVQGYDLVDIEDLTIQHFYGNRDTRVGGGVYDGAQWRRCGLLIDNNERVQIGLTTGETWREGPMVTARNVDVWIDFRFAGMAAFPASGALSTPLNAFWNLSDANCESMVINVHAWSGAWGGSAGNVGCPGDLVQNFYAPIVGKITAGSTGSDPLANSADNYGGGWDNSSELTVLPTRSITINHFVGTDLFRYGFFLYRTDTTRIGTLRGDIDIDGTSRAAKISYIDTINMKVKTRNVWRLTPDYGTDIDVSYVTAGTVAVDCDGSGTIDWTFSGDTLPTTKTSWQALAIESCGDVVFYGATVSYAHAHIDANYRTGSLSTDNVESVTLGDLQMRSGIYASAADLVPFVRLGRDAGKRLKAATLGNATFDDLPLVQSPQLYCWVVDKLPGAMRRVDGNPAPVMGANTLLHEHLIYAGDGSSSQNAIRGGWRAETVNDGAGRGLRVVWSVANTTSMRVDALSLEGNGQLRFVGIASAPGDLAAGDLYYNSTNGRHHVRTSSSEQRLASYADTSRLSFSVGNDNSTIAQNAVLGVYNFISGDASHTTAGVKASVTAYAQSATGRGAYVIIATALDDAALTNAVRINGNGSFETLLGRIDKTRVVTAAGAVTVATSDVIVNVNKTAGAATAVSLPASPEIGRIYIVKDGKGDAAANNITITPAAGTIDGAATYVISTNYGRVWLQYNGTEWNTI